jgi:hypothetical protein
MTGYILGAVACNAPGLSGYQFPILAADVFFGQAAVPVGEPVISLVFHFKNN